MKKIIVVLLCVANVTCLAMNKLEKDKAKLALLERSTVAQERKADALEFLAISRIAVECGKVWAWTDGGMLVPKAKSYYGGGFAEKLNCEKVLTQYHELLNKNDNHS